MRSSSIHNSTTTRRNTHQSILNHPDMNRMFPALPATTTTGVRVPPPSWHPVDTGAGMNIPWVHPALGKVLGRSFADFENTILLHPFMAPYQTLEDVALIDYRRFFRRGFQAHFGYWAIFIFRMERPQDGSFALHCPCCHATGKFFTEGEYIYFRGALGIIAHMIVDHGVFPKIERYRTLWDWILRHCIFGHVMDYNGHHHLLDIPEVVAFDRWDALNRPDTIYEPVNIDLTTTEGICHFLVCRNRVY